MAERRVDSIADLDVVGKGALEIADALNGDQPSNAVAWLEKNYGGEIYEFMDPEGLIYELRTNWSTVLNGEKCIVS